MRSNKSTIIAKTNLHKTSPIIVFRINVIKSSTRNEMAILLSVFPLERNLGMDNPQTRKSDWYKLIRKLELVIYVYKINNCQSVKKNC